MRRVNFQNEEFYHIYNRGNDKREIFIYEKDYIRFLTAMREFNRINPIGSLYDLKRQRINERAKVAKLLRSSLATHDQLVNIVCWCLIPNHFHFVLRQSSEKGISKFMHKLSYGYSRYFNIKYNRSGSLFEGTYKSIQIKSDEYLQYLSAYINANPEIHKIAPAESYQWSSYQDFLGKRIGSLSDKNIILDEFSDVKEYQEYVKTVANSSRERKDAIKEFFLE